MIWFEFFRKKRKTEEKIPKNIEAINLYRELCASQYTQYPYETKALGENMMVINEVISQYWKPRFLLDQCTLCAYEFMNGGKVLQTVTLEDIDWDTIPGEGHFRAQELSAMYPTFIGTFINGVAEVSWQLNPDGRYFMDDDGYGMTDDEEITVYGFIDRKGQVLVKFRCIEDWDELKIMRKEAEKYNLDKIARL